MNIDQWQFASWLCKVLLYISMAMSIGGLFSIRFLSSHAVLKQGNLRYVLMGGTLGVLTTLTAFDIQVGGAADQGWGGMYDPNIASMILHSHSGHAQVARLFGFVLIILLAKTYQGGFGLRQWWTRLMAVLAVVLLVFSFASQGHTANVGGVAPWLIFLHVLMMSIWMGALWPLWCASRAVAGQPLQQLMHQFGNLASVIVGVLIICGVTVALLLFDSLHTLLTTPYGYGFMLKLLLVALILLLAASHKWWLTPRLTQPAYANRLSRSIVLEMVVGVLILLVTGYITTVVGLE